MKRHLVKSDECNAFVLALAHPDDISNCVPVLDQRPRDPDCTLFRKNRKHTREGVEEVRAGKAEGGGKKRKVGA